MPLVFPVIYLLSAHLSEDELHGLESQIPTLTYDITEAEVILGKVSRKERALLELRQRKLVTEEVSALDHDLSPRAKRRKISASFNQTFSTDSETASDGEVEKSVAHLTQETVKVVKLAWLTDSIAKGKVQPFSNYLVYEGRKVPSTPKTASATTPKSTLASPPPPSTNVEDILNRARADGSSSKLISSSRFGHQSSWRRSREHHGTTIKPPQLLKQTTSEHDIDLQLPPIPDFLHTSYSCQRLTPVNPPNEQFIEQLTKIRTTRTLIGDKIGVRAYSSAIATIAAYPYLLSSTQEVARLPGCGSKIAVLFEEFKDRHQLQEVIDAESDPRLAVMRMFYEIWGVAETTAREFYNKGWRDLDDIVEYGWESLSRVQQIGTKYYDEFQLKIPRDEVEAIANTILERARRITPGFEMVIVGGYRRGKKASGDVDLILSHRDEEATNCFVEKIVLSLEKDRYITHTLTLSTKNSERGQMPVGWRGNEKRAGAGFDTLDKALVVWQDPKWEGDAKKNPNPHRRVDIIISPWKTTGCAVLGWTSGTTFQRDLRRYCKKERSLKFDSSGIRSRADGAWVDLESSPDGSPAPDMLTAERRVFEGLELEWRRPEDRCTG